MFDDVASTIHMSLDTGRSTALWNALKYSSAFPVIIGSALKYHVPHHQWLDFYRPVWLLCSLVNTVFSFYWDITHDWDLTLFSCCGRAWQIIPPTSSYAAETLVTVKPARHHPHCRSS